MAEKAKSEELVPVGPGADEEDVRAETDERVDDGETRDSGDDDVDRQSDDEERVAGTDDADEDREEIRRRRRAEKQRKKENRNRERLELNFLRNRNEQLERRQSELDARVANGEMVMIDNKIAELDGQIREAERIKALAIDKSDGASAAEADRIANDLRVGRTQLQNLKTQRENNARVRPQPAADPQIQMHAREWAEDHDWYDTNLRNADSKVAKAVEEAIFTEGNFDPRTPDYWEELDRRLKKYLPHRYKNKAGNGADRDDEDERDDDREEEVRQERRPRGPQVRVGGRERPLKKNEVFISAERKEAMMEAGVWDDPVLREKYLRQYQKFDRENRRH